MVTSSCFRNCSCMKVTEIYLKCRREIYWGEGSKNLNRISTKATAWIMNFWASDIPLLLISLIKSQSPEKEDPIDQHRDTNSHLGFSRRWKKGNKSSLTLISEGWQREVGLRFCQELWQITQITLWKITQIRDGQAIETEVKGWMLTSQEQTKKYFSRKKKNIYIYKRTIHNVHVCILPYIMHIFLESFLISAIKG